MIVYLHENNLFIRSMDQEDIVSLSAAFSQQGWSKPLDVLEAYFVQQENGKRRVVVAEVKGKAAGYVTLLPEAKTGPFALSSIPEIVDFNVFIEFQRRGIGNTIMDIAERLASVSCGCVSLAVGLHSGYGSAQRMYAKRGYIPDGSGVWYRDKQLEPYASCINDDSLIMYMKKDL